MSQALTIPVAPAPEKSTHDLLVQVAERLGLADTRSGRATLDPSKSTYAQLIRAFNEAGDEFTNAHDWSWRDEVHEFTLSASDPWSINGSDTMFLLPPQVIGPGSDQSSWSGGNMTGGKLTRVSRQRVSRWLADDTFPGNPKYYAILETRIGPDIKAPLTVDQRNFMSGRPTMAVLVYPRPLAGYTASISVRIAFLPVSDDATAHQPPWPSTCDKAVMDLMSARFLRGGPSVNNLSAASELAAYGVKLDALKKENDRMRGALRRPGRQYTHDDNDRRRAGRVTYQGNVIME